MKHCAQSRIFVSYGRRGKGLRWKAALLQALNVLEQHRLLDVWEDGDIRVGSDWDGDIKHAMSNAQLAVVLLTKEALASPYIVNTELPFLRDRRSRGESIVFPVICEECSWKAHDWLASILAPNAGRPLDELNQSEQDQAFRKLATGIAEELSRGALAGYSALHGPRSEIKTYLDQFPLTRGPGLREEEPIGREQELALLDLAFAQPHTAIVSLVAWGGVGKTMLVQHWLKRLQREGWFGAQRVYAWSFYSQGTKEDRQASEDTFLAHALEWFGVRCEPRLSPWDKGRLLADAVARECTLLILDGVEPLQYPPGPMGGQLRKVGKDESHLRAPGVQSLLKHLARKANSEFRGQKAEASNCLCLVTTRVWLADLSDFQRREGSPWGSVLRVDLGNLTDEAGAALLHHAGAKRAGAAEIKSDDKELLTASGEVDGHALTLNLLGHFIARAHVGDIRHRDLVNFEEADLKEQGGTTFKMLAAFEKWFEGSAGLSQHSLAILRIISLFSRPADVDCLTVLRNLPAIVGLTKPLFRAKRQFLGISFGLQPCSNEDWCTAVSFLSEFGLINIQQHLGKILLDCHPLIREYFGKRLLKRSSKSWRSAHRRIYNHLCAATKESAQPTLDELQPLYQAVAHGCLAGLQREAHRKVYYDRILLHGQGYSHQKLGAFCSNLEAAACFFESPWNRVSHALSKDTQAWYLNEAGFCLRAVGRVGEAVAPLCGALDRDIKMMNWKAAVVSATNLSELYLVLGQVPTAVKLAHQSVAFADRSDDQDRKMGTRTGYADALHQSGKKVEADALFREAEALLPEFPVLYSQWGFRYCDLLLAPAERYAWNTLLNHGRLLLPQSQRITLHEGGEHIRRSQRAELADRMVPGFRAIARRAALSLEAVEELDLDVLSGALDHLTLARAALYEAVLSAYPSSLFSPPSISIDHTRSAMASFRLAGQAQELPRCLLTRAWMQAVTGACTGSEGAQTDLDEAWDIAERGPMRLHMADIHLYRARLFFREKQYPWESPAADLAAAEQLIQKCGYHRRDEELADAKSAILGA